jgi:hypothetical protein
MVSSGLLRRVALIRTDVSEAQGSSYSWVLLSATRRNNPEDTILRYWSCWDASAGSLFVARRAVSSANVAVVVLLVVGKSDLYSMY